MRLRCSVAVSAREVQDGAQDEEDALSQRLQLLQIQHREREVQRQERYAGDA
jgi:hypothetical protein